MGADLDDGWDEQDQSEVFDEDNQSLDGTGDASNDMKTLEELPDVLDVTRAAGDEDDDEALIAEELDDDEIIELEADSDSADIEDDGLRGRMPEAFDDDSDGEDDVEEVYFDVERGLDLRDANATPDEAAEPAVSRLSHDEPELDYDDDIDDEADEDSSVMEAANVSDEELERLGYRIDPR
jgi:hypothetical protein